MMKKNKTKQAKKYIITGYPPTKYFFTGKWIELYNPSHISQKWNKLHMGYYKINKDKYFAPVYKDRKDINGKKIIDMTQRIKV